MAQNVHVHLNNTVWTFEKSARRYGVVVWVLLYREQAFAISCEAFSIKSM